MSRHETISFLSISHSLTFLRPLAILPSFCSFKSKALSFSFSDVPADGVRKLHRLLVAMLVYQKGDFDEQRSKTTTLPLRTSGRLRAAREAEASKR